ncbi:unnamed protein product [Blumeria hordei]|uniref:Sedlin n=2 Tax=Blumeria hordei TaxID=2867405 RepID=A0A383USE3_BLUHO|nr:unnamed protein product [Blumeria hordei]
MKMSAVPSIACLAVIGKDNNPLHVTIFPSTAQATPILTPLQTSFLLSSTLDVFHARSVANHTTGVGLSGDYGLLHAIDERLAAYGYETNTAVRFVAIVDFRGRLVSPDHQTGPGSDGAAGGMGMRDGELKAVFRSMQSAYIRLLQNPFYDPDEHVVREGRGGKRITSRRFIEDIRRIGEQWIPESMAV